MKCPKCGSEQIESKSCVNCGVIFENFYRSQKKSATKTPPVSSPKALSKQEVVKRDLNSIHGLAFGTVVILVAIKAIFVGFDIVSAMILVPFYFCYVSALTAFLGDAFYVYWRWEGKFMPYEGRWRTPLVVFYIVFSIVFAGMYFKLTKYA
jgi:hypothetical protein